jgi:hypothetical protein
MKTVFGSAVVESVDRGRCSVSEYRETRDYTHEALLAEALCVAISSDLRSTARS